MKELSTDYQKAIQEIVDPIATPEPKLTVFLSLDLENSTELKEKAKDKWLSIVETFYDSSVAEITKSLFSASSIWKYVGDEVLFYEHLSSKSQLIELIEKCHNSLKTINTRIRNATDGQELGVRLSVKATLWIAATISDSSSDTLTPNRMISAPRQGVMDFIGPEIDIGFRLGKFIEKGQLAVSAELAYLLQLVADGTEVKTKVDAIISKLKRVSLKKLKGVWANRAYPIIWYIDSTFGSSDQFEYDDFLESELIKSVVNNDLKDCNDLSKIFQTVKKVDRVEEMFLLYKDLPEEHSSDSNIDPNNNQLLEVHCAAIIFNSNNEALLLLRSKSRKLHPNCWEFGCAQLRTGLSFKQAIIEDYKSKLNIEITEVSGLPVATYEIEHPWGIVPGIILEAKTNSSSDLKLNQQKHQDYKWVSLDELGSIDGNFVPGGKNVLQRAFKQRRLI